MKKLCLVVSALLFSSCVRDFNLESNSQSFSRFELNRQNFESLTAYHWTFDAEALTDPKTFLANEARSSSHNVKLQMASTAFPSLAIVGHGLYLAADPVASYTYGNILVSVKVNKTSNVPILRYFQPDDIRKYVTDEKLPVLVYRWEQSTDIFGKGAAVVRDPNVLDLSSVRVSDFRQPKDFCSHPPVDSLPDLQEFFESYGDVLSAVEVLQIDDLRNPDGSSTLFDSKFQLTEVGVTAAALMEMASLPESIQPVAKSMLAARQIECASQGSVEATWRRCVTKLGFSALTKGNVDPKVALLFRKLGYLEGAYFTTNEDLRKSVNSKWAAKCSSKNIRNFEGFLQTIYRSRNDVSSAPWHTATKSNPVL